MSRPSNEHRLSESEEMDTDCPSQKPTLNITRAVKQYLYDSNNVEYLDCCNSSAHVGHCHPQVVGIGQQQMGKLVTAQGFVSENLRKYVMSLVASLPESLSVCFFTTSGPEANDLAMCLVKRYTKETDIMVVEDAHHGNIGIMLDLSPKMWSKVPAYKKPSHVHVVPLPDRFRGQHDYSDEEASIKYAAVVKSEIEKLEAKGKKLAAFISEPYFVESGVHPPTSQYYQQVYSAVRAHGGLVIADESRTGLGRTGEHMWAFQSFGVVPDIVTIGRSMSNGYPMGAVICSREVSERLGGYFSTFGGNPVACAIGLTVLEVIANEMLMSSAKMVGRSLQSSLHKLMDKHECLGDIRGSGLIWAIEIVDNKRENKPEPKLASEIMYRLKEKQVLVDLTGRNENVILFSPPMCFTMENGRVFTNCLDEVLVSTSNRAPEPPSHQRISHAPSSVIVANTALGVRKYSLFEEAIGEFEKAIGEKRARMEATMEKESYEQMD